MNTAVIWAWCVGYCAGIGFMVLHDVGQSVGAWLMWGASYVLAVLIAAAANKVERP